MVVQGLKVLVLYSKDVNRVVPQSQVLLVEEDLSPDSFYFEKFVFYLLLLQRLLGQLLDELSGLGVVEFEVPELSQQSLVAQMKVGLQNAGELQPVSVVGNVHRVLFELLQNRQEGLPVLDVLKDPLRDVGLSIEVLDEL